MTEVVAEIRGYVVENMGPMQPGETIVRGLERAARCLGISYARTVAYWYRKVRRVDADEADRIRLRAIEMRRRKLEQMTASYQEEAAAYEALRTQLLQTAPRALAWLVPPAAPVLAGLPRDKEGAQLSASKDADQ